MIVWPSETNENTRHTHENSVMKESKQVATINGLTKDLSAMKKNVKKENVVGPFINFSKYSVHFLFDFIISSFFYFHHSLDFPCSILFPFFSLSLFHKEIFAYFFFIPKS